MNNKPKLQLKNIKYSEFASHETYCFDATLYVDGKKFAHVGNEGYGGCNDCHMIAPFTYDDYKKIDDLIKANYPEKKYSFCDDTYRQDIESVVNDLMDEWLTDKDIKRALKKICFIKDSVHGNKKNQVLYFMGNTKTDKEKARRAVFAKYPNALILNDLPMDEVRQYFI
jgi:hypothetical protein